MIKKNVNNNNRIVCKTNSVNVDNKLQIKKEKRNEHMSTR